MFTSHLIVLKWQPAPAAAMDPPLRVQHKSLSEMKVKSARALSIPPLKNSILHRYITLRLVFRSWPHNEASFTHIQFIYKTLHTNLPLHFLIRPVMPAVQSTLDISTIFFLATSNLFQEKYNLFPSVIKQGKYSLNGKVFPNFWRILCYVWMCCLCVVYLIGWPDTQIKAKNLAKTGSNKLPRLKWQCDRTGLVFWHRSAWYSHK